MHKIFGIRHHGPGSAKSLQKALEEMQPDCIVIEGPLDAENILHHVANEGFKPPVAILMYNPKLPSQAAYFPFCKFSPEWQAMKYGLANNIPIKFMDLPQGIHFTLNTNEEVEQQIALETQVEPEGETKKIIQDPLGYMARLGGYGDSERWWETMFEQGEGHSETFNAIQDLMMALREEVGKQESPRTLLREAHMRKILRKAIKEYENVAVVCGAWHGPVLEDLKKFKATDDNKLLRGIKKTSTKATWVPWTHDRIAASSGYGAGVVSPAWYEMLFSNRKNASLRWMTKVARLFRREDLDASSAHVIEAVRLADTLAAMRGLSIPGMDEMYEAAVTLFCDGYDSPMDLVKKKLIIGDKMGQVPDEIPVIPLQQDLDKQISSARMKKYKQTLEPQERELDLRQATQLKASQLLHRMNLLGIPWGSIKENRRRYYGKTQGDFKENWKLRWRPDFAISIIEAGMWGNTVENASIKKLAQQATEIESLPDITALLGAAIKADLPTVMDVLLRVFNDSASLTKDITHLMTAVPKLVEAMRYANTRQFDVEVLQKQLDQIIPRICIGLPNACVSLNEDSASEMFRLISQMDYQISLIDQEEHTEEWLFYLDKVAKFGLTNGIIRGGVTRILYDRRFIQQEETHTRMSLALSKGTTPLEAAYWITGFLHGSGLVLIHDPYLWNILDQWVEGVPYEAFRDILPVLRRTFTRFPKAEREQMMKLSKKKNQVVVEAESESLNLHPERGARVVGTLQMILGG